MKMQKKIRVLVLYLVSALFSVSCVSMTNKSIKPDKAYIACKYEFLCPQVKITKEYYDIPVVAPMKSEKIYKVFHIKESTKAPVYDYIAVKPGTYVLSSPYYFYSILFGLNYTVHFRIPENEQYVFKINPGEVFYLGDYLLDHSGDEPILTKSSNIDECRDALVAKHPELDGFVWLTPDIDRSPF